MYGVFSRCSPTAGPDRDWNDGSAWTVLFFLILQFLLWVLVLPSIVPALNSSETFTHIGSAPLCSLSFTQVSELENLFFSLGLKRLPQIWVDGNGRPNVIRSVWLCHTRAWGFLLCENKEEVVQLLLHNTLRCCHKSWGVGSQRVGRGLLMWTRTMVKDHLGVNQIGSDTRFWICVIGCTLQRNNLSFWLKVFSVVSVMMSQICLRVSRTELILIWMFWFGSTTEPSLIFTRTSVQKSSVPRIFPQCPQKSHRTWCWFKHRLVRSSLVKILTLRTRLFCQILPMTPSWNQSAAVCTRCGQSS